MQYKRNAHEDDYVSQQMDYGRQHGAKQRRKSRSNHGSSRSASSFAVNGIHRRRNKRWAW